MKRLDLCRAEGALIDALNALDDAPHSTEDRELLAPVVKLIDEAIKQVQYGLSDEGHDEAYERAAARARANDFVETGGKDWT